MVFQLRHHPLTQPTAGLDTTAYAELAQRVIAGDWGLGPGLYYVSPLYIYFLAVFRGLAGSYTAVRVIQIGLGTIAVGAIFSTTRDWFGPRAARISAGLAALTGLFTFYEALILQSSIDVFLTAVALLCLTRALKRDSTGWFFATGLVFGIQTMNRPQVAIAIAGVMLVMLLMRRWRTATLLAAGLLIGLSPAATRNAVVSHEFSLLSSHGGLNFYIGNHAGADGFYQIVPGITPSIKGQQEDARHVAERAVGHALTDAQTSDYFVDQSLKWIAAHPGDAALLMITKLGLVFHAQHVALPYSYPFYQYDVPSLLRFLIVGPWLLVPLGLVGLVLARPKRCQADYLIWAAFVPSYAIAVAMFFMSERYRLPLLVPLVTSSGGAISYLIDLTTARRAAMLTGTVGAILIIGVLVNTRGGANDGRWQERLRMADQLVILGRYDEAGTWVEKLETNPAQPGLAYMGVGSQLLAEQQPQRAVEYFRKAVAVNRMQYPAAYYLAETLKRLGDTSGAAAVIPQIVMGSTATAEEWLTVGRLATELGAPDAAEPFFRKATELDPGSAGARQQYGVNLVLLRRFADGARELTEASHLNPGDAATWSHLAYCEAKLGRIIDARQHLAAALAIDSSDPMALQLAAAIR